MSNLKDLIRKFQETAKLDLKRPKEIPDTLFYQALATKKQYMESWDFWVTDVSKRYEVSFDEAEIACVRGIKKECDLVKETYGELQGNWLMLYLEMQELFEEVSLEEYVDD